MTDTELFNCVYCKKTYKTPGWLANHIKKKHEDANLSDQEITFMNDYAKDISQQKAAQDLSEISPWDNNTLTSPPGPTSTPRAPGPVPLCLTADSYIQRRVNTLPASFLATLLPAPGFLMTWKKVCITKPIQQIFSESLRKKFAVLSVKFVD